mgnify:CR=1 FL=1
MAYYANQTNPAEDKSGYGNVSPTGKVYNEEEFMDLVFEKCSHLGKDKFDQIIADIKEVAIELMEKEGVDELPWKQLPDGTTINFVKPDTTAEPPEDQPQ